MRFNPLIPELSVSDIEASRRFYVDLLGFGIVYERPSDKFLFIERSGCQLMLEQVNGCWSVGELQYPFGRGINLEMAVPDLDALHRRLLESGAALFRPLSESRYETLDGVEVQREFLIQDPDGYLLRFTD